MQKALMIMALLMCVSGATVFADDASTNAVAPGNQGYVYGSAPKQDDSTAAASTPTPAPTSAPADSSTTDIGVIGDIWHGIMKLDDWIKENLW